MLQYHKIKESHPDAVLLFRIGDFYETFDEDAKTASRVLGITLTRRSNGAAGDVPLAGFPHHALDTYLPKLVRAGLRVAICEQMEDPKQAKGIVKREVTEMVTPGVAFSEKLLDHKKNNYLLAVMVSGDIAGLSFCDISTGEYYAYEIHRQVLRDQIELISPAEILARKGDIEMIKSLYAESEIPSRFTKIDDWVYNQDYASEQLLLQFKTVSLKGFGIEHLTAGLSASGVIIHYLRETQKANPSHLNKVLLYNPSDYMQLDRSTKRNLEIIYSMQDGSREGTLISILDKTETPMGARLLKRWVSAPLRKLEPILQRQNIIEGFYHQKELRLAIREDLKEIGDLERLTSKICTGRATPRDLTALKNSLEKLPLIAGRLLQSSDKAISAMSTSIHDLKELAKKIETTLTDNPPASIGEGGYIRAGFSPELDELRDLSFHGKDWIARLQKDERERTGIGSLKVSYNKVFGYYIEISNANKDKVPADYIRKQTLVSSERYITPELKEYEDKILTADEKIAELEYQLFNELRIAAASYSEKIQSNAQAVARIDCYLSFAECAEAYNYVKPELDESGVLEIVEGRHPVVERILKPGEKFTPNSCHLNNEDAQIILLTGPNMAGKSVYLRQTGLIVLLAQIGSFVPAKKARLGIIDRIFTRVGASDNISAGESTFLVEMQEAANILNNATAQSLILLDEIGRGTSTFDGLSIAWAITEYIHENSEIAAKTLFATHYHEINEMAELFPRIKNYKVEVIEHGDRVIFLHKVSPGQADHSYGIQVAQMAGLPRYVTTRAKEILANLESKELTPHLEKKERIRKAAEHQHDLQMSLFEVKDDRLRKRIDDLEINSLTPLDALNELYELKKSLKEKE